MGQLITIEELAVQEINHDRDWFLVYMSLPNRASIVNLPSPELNQIDQQRKRSEFVNWLARETDGRYHSYGRAYWFELEEDAVLFQLRWG